MSGPRIDLVSPASFADGQPYEQYRWLRANDPVHWHDEAAGKGFWAVTRYADVRTVSRDPSTYSSWLGGIMLPDGSPEMLAGARLMMLYMDGADHTRYRRLVNRAFTPRAAAGWDRRIAELATRIVDAVIGAGHCDLVADLAGEMPSYVIAELMGIPLDDGRRLYELTEAMHAAETEADGEVTAHGLEALIEMHTYAAGVAAEKKAHPGDDLATALVHAEIDGDRLSDDDFNWFFLLLVNAGGDTTRNLIAGGIEALLRQPQRWAQLCADPDGLMATTVEELLRFVSPVVHMRRTATVDTCLGDRPIAAGDKVVVFYGSANRDERAYSDPDTLDLGRHPNPHLAFGAGGPHHCLGAHFARLETSHLLHEIVTRMPDLAIAVEPTRLASNFVAGPKELPVTFTPGVAAG